MVVKETLREILDFLKTIWNAFRFNGEENVSINIQVEIL